MRQEAIEQRTSLWRLPAMQALVGVTSLGFASYCLTLASLPTYAVLGGTPAATAGLVTAVFLLGTILLQGTPPAPTARFGAPKVLVAVPAGVALVLAGHAAVMAWLAASPLLGILLVPVLARAVAGQVDGDAAGSGRAAALAALLPSTVLFAVTLAGGGVVTFLPIERPDGSTATIALLLFGVTAALGRWRAGLPADRPRGPGP